MPLGKKTGRTTSEPLRSAGVSGAITPHFASPSTNAKRSPRPNARIIRPSSEKARAAASIGRAMIVVASSSRERRLTASRASISLGSKTATWRSRSTNRTSLPGLTARPRLMPGER